MRSAEVEVGEEPGFGCEDKEENGLGPGDSKGRGVLVFLLFVLKDGKNNHLFKC